MILTVKQLQQDSQIQELLRLSDMQLQVMGYTDHGERHRTIVVKRALKILQAADADEREQCLGAIAAYLHDIGCCINRHNHAQSGGIMLLPLLTARGMDYADSVIVANAVANHDEKTGCSCNKVAAALILADKSDVHRNRVRRDKLDERRKLKNKDDIHDRVNYSVIDSRLDVDATAKQIVFRFVLDSNVASAMEYFEIFLGRMKMCKQAATVLGMTFNLEINGQILA